MTVTLDEHLLSEKCVGTCHETYTCNDSQMGWTGLEKLQGGAKRNLKMFNCDV